MCWAAAGAEQCTPSSAYIMTWEPAACAADASSEPITAPKEQLHPLCLRAMTYFNGGSSQLQRIPYVKWFQFSYTYVSWRSCEPLKGKDWEFLIVLKEGALCPTRIISKYEGRQLNLKYWTDQQQLRNLKSRLLLCPWLTLWCPEIARSSAQCMVLCVIGSSTY